MFFVIQNVTNVHSLLFLVWEAINSIDISQADSIENVSLKWLMTFAFSSIKVSSDLLPWLITFDVCKIRNSYRVSLRG